MSRRRFIILSVFLAVTFSVMSRNKDGRVAVHFGWNAGGVSYKVWICPLLEREREKKTKWLFEAFAERSKKLVSVSAALTEMTQNCKTGATVKSNCPPWSSESAKDWKQLQCVIIHPSVRPPSPEEGGIPQATPGQVGGSVFKACSAEMFSSALIPPEYAQTLINYPAILSTSGEEILIRPHRH